MMHKYILVVLFVLPFSVFAQTGKLSDFTGLIAR